MVFQLRLTSQAKSKPKPADVLLGVKERTVDPKILIADDDAEITRLLSVYLQANGFTIMTAADAMQTARLSRFVDAILLDVHLPGGDGMDVLTRVKRAPQTKSVPVIMLTADPGPELPQRALALGASDFLHKPLDLEQLLASLKSSLQLTDLGKAPAQAVSAASAENVAVLSTAPSDGPKILVAEDDPFHQRVLQKFLPKWGYQIETATDGNRALEILRSPDAPRLALLDWMMPGMDGPSICRELRHQQAREYTYSPRGIRNRTWWKGWKLAPTTTW